MVKTLKVLTAQEVLAFAIQSEEEDGRIYADLAQRIRKDYPATAQSLQAMHDEEDGHRHRLISAYRERFGEHVPLIRRQDVKGFITRKPLWVAANLTVAMIRREVEMMEDEARNFYQAAIAQTSDAGVRQLLGDLASEESRHYDLAEQMDEKQRASGVSNKENESERRRFVLRPKRTSGSIPCLNDGPKDLANAKKMKNAGIVLLLTCASVSLAHADVVGTLNVHTMSDGQKTTGRDSGQPIAVQVDFSKTQDGTYDVTVWSGDRQFDKTTRVYVQEGKAARREESYQNCPITIYCPATDLQQNGPTSFQVFVQAVLDNGQKGGRVPIAEADWQLSSVDDDQPGKKIEPRQVICSAGSNLDSHATGSFIIENQGKNSRQATLFFGGRKYGDYDLSGHAKQRIQADAWGVNPGVGWYITTPNPFSPNGHQIEAAGPIYNTEGGSEAGFNAVELDGLNPSSTPMPGPSASPSKKP